MDTFGLVGFPLGHSFSKRYFTEKFEQEGINGEYLNFETDDILSLREIVRQYPDLKGLNVTIPYKEKVIGLLDRVSEEAQKIGAVNTIKIERKNGNIILSGYNTDVLGFKFSLLDFIPKTIQKALVLGNGGAAKAVRYALESLHMEVLTVSRTPKSTNEISYQEVIDYLPDHTLIVNTTPLGTWPNTEICAPIPYGALTPNHYLYDLVYNPETTEFMKRGMIQGAHTHNGLKMLHMQAEEAWKIWNLSPLT